MLSPELFLVGLLECSRCTGCGDELIVALAVFLCNAPSLAFLTCRILAAQQADVITCIGTFSREDFVADAAPRFESSVVSHRVFRGWLLGNP